MYLETNAKLQIFYAYIFTEKMLHIWQIKIYLYCMHYDGAIFTPSYFRLVESWNDLPKEEKMIYHNRSDELQRKQGSGEEKVRIYVYIILVLISYSLSQLYIVMMFAFLFKQWLLTYSFLTIQYLYEWIKKHSFLKYRFWPEIICLKQTKRRAKVKTEGRRPTRTLHNCTQWWNEINRLSIYTEV